MDRPGVNEVRRAARTHTQSQGGVNENKPPAQNCCRALPLHSWASRGSPKLAALINIYWLGKFADCLLAITGKAAGKRPAMLPRVVAASGPMIGSELF